MRTASEPGRAKPASQPKVMIESPAVYADKRRLALITIWVPTLGTALAIALAVVNGIGWVEIALLVSMYSLTMFGLEVGFHRAFSHKAFASSSSVQGFMAICGSMAAQGTILYWIATHRRHHRHSDTAEDPHSPHWRMGDHGPEKLGHVRGLWHAQMGNMYTDLATNCTLFARDVLRDPIMMKLNAQYRLWVLVGVVIPTVIGAVAYQSAYGALMGFLWGGLVRIFLTHHSYFTNASFSHRYGAKPFDNGDQSSNNLWCMIPTFGSGLQNNHHAFPASAQLGLKAWEIDIGGWIISVMQRLGLAREVRRVTPEMIAMAHERASRRSEAANAAALPSQ